LISQAESTPDRVARSGTLSLAKQRRKHEITGLFDQLKSDRAGQDENHTETRQQGLFTESSIKRKKKTNFLKNGTRGDLTGNLGKYIPIEREAGRSKGQLPGRILKGKRCRATTKSSSDSPEDFSQGL